jgi:hypothetical protein
MLCGTSCDVISHMCIALKVVNRELYRITGKCKKSANRGGRAV